MIASAIAVPVTVVLAFVLTAGQPAGRPKSSGTGSSTAGTALPGVTVPAPPTPNAATQAACVKVFARLPVQLGQLPPRKT